ncbi:MAG: prolipoprotein diacylglyceryl transferase [Rhodospirillaceae bacterium]|nr:prolipoprotein diacylglyceryl transferase [Rhodospirillaceae bacterium]
MLTLAFPVIDPVAIEIGPIVVRWYALAYIAGLLLGWRYMLHLADRAPKFMTRTDVDDFLSWATFAVILGGRLGYVLLYRPDFYFDYPLEALYVWRGGMSFHGGLIGMLIAIAIFARRRKIDGFAFGDVVACATPIGLFFGRIANFINGELWGRTSDVSWAMVFPNGGPEPRHPSQLYEAVLEGLVLFVVLHLLARKQNMREHPGRLGGIFLAGYALARFAGEFFREPDIQFGILLGGLTYGQLLCLPMLAVGLFLVLRKPAKAGAPAR